MTVTVIPLSDFMHDDYSFVEGRQRSNVPEQLANDMEQRGLVRIVVPGLRGRRILGLPLGKVQAAGEAPPSSALPADPAFAEKTRTPYTSGEIPTRPRAR